MTTLLNSNLLVMAECCVAAVLNVSTSLAGEHRIAQSAVRIFGLNKFPLLMFNVFPAAQHRFLAWQG
jgi:hypothetical protein